MPHSIPNRQDVSGECEPNLEMVLDLLSTVYTAWEHGDMIDDADRAVIEKLLRKHQRPTRPRSAKPAPRGR